LRIVHSFVYAGKPKEDFIRTLSLRLPLETTGAANWALGGEKGYSGMLAAGEAVSLWEVGPAKIYHLAPYTQDKTVTYTVQSAKGGTTREIAQGKEAAGWARLTDKRAELQVGLRNFWQMHPKQLEVDASGVTVYLWPEAGGKVLDLRRRYDEVENKYHYDLSLWPYGGEGVGLTHELTLRFGPAREASAAALTEALNTPTLLECAPQTYAASGAFGPFAVADPVHYPRLEAFQNVIVEWMRANQRAFHWDGMIDYGDTLFHGYATASHYGYIGEKAWCSRGYVGWLDNDGTMGNGLLMHYLRTGDYETFRAAEAMIRHVTEVDCCHYCAEEPKQVGGGHRHDQQHWGNGVRGYGTATYESMSYYLLTGDERALEVAKEYGQYHYDGEPSENEDRIGGLIRLWEITGEARLKQKADELVAAELVVPKGQPWPFVTTAHFRFVGNTSTSFMYYLTCAPPADSAKLREAIIKAADAIEPQSVSSWGQVDYLPLIVTSLAYQATGDQRYAKETACLVQRLPVPRTHELPEDYLTVLRGLKFADMVPVAQSWAVNNLYMASIHGLVPLPYAIAALQKGGVDEAAAWALPRANSSPPPFEDVLDPAKMNHEFGFLYVAYIPHGSPSDAGGGHSNITLLEDGKPLGPAHSSHASIRAEGKGRYSHWGAQAVWFATSDNSDPRANGRVYKVIYPGPGK
jgi:hypothetical protein